MLWHRLDKELPPLRKPVLIWRGMSDSDGGFPMMGKHVLFEGKSYIRYKGADNMWCELNESEYKDTRWAEVERPEDPENASDCYNCPKLADILKDTDDYGEIIDFCADCPELKKHISPHEFYNRMMLFKAQEDIASRHERADILICAVLSQLGYKDGADVFSEMPKWYA